MNQLKKLTTLADSLKRNPKSLQSLIYINALWASVSIFVDLPWLLSVPWYLTPFTPICSLYPLLLTIWCILYKKNQQPPATLTTFTFIGCISYGILAQIYFPLYMSWEARGFNFYDAGSMLWVAVYGLQAFILASELKILKPYQYLLIFSYFAIKDYSDLVFKTFVDFLIADYPVWIMHTMLISGIIIQLFAAFLSIFLPYKKRAISNQS